MPFWGRLFRRAGNTRYDNAIRLFDAGRYREAIHELQAVLAEPSPGELTERLARFYLAEAYTALATSQAGLSVEEAVTSFTAALAIHPTYADLHFKLGCVLVRSGDVGKAGESFAQALAINPSFNDAKRMQDALAAGIGVALAELDALADAERDEALRFAKTAQNLYRNGNFEEAASAYRQALSLKPTYADLHNQLGVTLHAIGEDSGAVEAFTRAIEINPKYIEAQLNRGLALRRVGRENEARADFARVLELDPTNHAAKEALAG